MNDLTNFIKFDSDDIETATGKGLISTIERDMEIEAIPYASDNEKAPTHRLYARSPRGFRLEVGGIWKKYGKTNDRDYFSLSIKRLAYNANLGKFPDQDDASLQAIIEWEPREVNGRS